MVPPIHTLNFYKPNAKLIIFPINHVSPVGPVQSVNPIGPVSQFCGLNQLVNPVQVQLVSSIGPVCKSVHKI